MTISVTIVPSPMITIRSHLYLPWARNALRNYAGCRDARSEAMRAATAPGRVGRPAALAREWDAALMSITAASFALEALYGALKELKFAPSPGKETAAWLRIVETLEAGFDVPGNGQPLRDDLQWLFRCRNNAVHFQEAYATPGWHPAGTNVAPEQIVFSLEGSQRAVDVLMEVVELCASRPKLAVTRQWSQERAANFDEIRQLRSTV